MNRLIIESDTHGWLELDEPVPLDFAESIRREFQRVSWPPIGVRTVMDEPVEVVDRRPPKPTTRRILINVPPRDPGDDRSVW